ncbi:hypothetical protein ACFFWC_18715 [Plantactinospora siamensis]|uniref:Mce-associated membrane protein n=1 Tax=Plantactinospora siamensis TaxID=555372 RepID=A0ABV6P371_9ACTN
MPAPEEHPLKLVKGLTQPAREVRLRSLPRRPAEPVTPLRAVPVPEDATPTDAAVGQVAALLARLDEEPVTDEPSDGPAGPAPVARVPALAPTDDATAPTAASRDDVVSDAAGSAGDTTGSAGAAAEPAEHTGAPAADPTAPAAGRAVQPPAGHRRVVIGLLALVLVAVAAVAVVLGHRWYVARAVDAAHQAALAAAKQETVNFVSVSAASVDRDLQRISAGATGEFKDEFTRGQEKVRAAVVENKVDSRGTVLRAGLVSGDRRSATVLVAVDATVKNAKAPDGRLSHYRIQVELARDRASGTWLVSRLQFVG